MLISGFQPLTLLDYPGKLAALIFTAGCPWRCGYCHNPELVLPESISKKKFIDPEIIFNHLKKRHGLLDGLVISGGEPTIQPDLPEFIKQVKNLGFLVKLDSSGLYPQVLEKLISQNLIDYIAMDIKTSLEKYSQLVDRPVDIKAIKSSIKLIKDSGLDYEFRTTLIPGWHDASEIKKIGQLIKGAKIWYAQAFRPGLTLNPQFAKRGQLSSSSLDELATIMENYVKTVAVRD